MKLNSTSLVFLICSIGFFVGSILSFILTDGVYGYISLALGAVWLCLGAVLAGKNRSNKN